MVRQNEIKEMREELGELQARWKQLQEQARKRKLLEKLKLISDWHYHVWGVEHKYDEKTHDSIREYGLKVVGRFDNFSVYHKGELVLAFNWKGELEKYRPGTWEKSLNALHRRVLEDKLWQDIHEVRQHLY